MQKNFLRHHPISTLQILNEINIANLYDESRALYGLLYTSSRYKCILLIYNDAFIDFSISYYKKYGDDKRLANTYYYKGAIKYVKKDFSKINFYMKLAEEISENLNDELLRNKIYERLAYINFVIECGNQSFKYSKRF